MPHDFFYVNDQYPLTTNVYRSDGVTPQLPQSATIDVVNQSTGISVVTGGSCAVASGLATYLIESGSQISQTPGHYMGYMRVQIDASSAQTNAVPFDVYDKGSYLAVERWRMKVQDSAPSMEHTSDDHGRDWIDQAVDWLNKRYATGYTSMLGLISPNPTTNDLEFISSVASLMARTAWWAGKGNWRDAEMSFNGSPFESEWKSLMAWVDTKNAEDWYFDPVGGDMFNRDDVYYDGVKYDSPGYWHRDPGDPEPITDIPI